MLIVDNTEQKRYEMIEYLDKLGVDIKIAPSDSYYGYVVLTAVYKNTNIIVKEYDGTEIHDSFLKEQLQEQLKILAHTLSKRTIVLSTIPEIKKQCNISDYTIKIEKMHKKKFILPFLYYKPKENKE